MPFTNFAHTEVNYCRAPAIQEHAREKSLDLCLKKYIIITSKRKENST